MPLFEQDWTNLNTIPGHVELAIPWDDFYSVVQMRHYFFLAIPISPLKSVYTMQITRGFHYQILDEFDEPTFDQEIELRFDLTFMIDMFYGQASIPFFSYDLGYEKFKTMMVNGVPTAEVTVRNTDASSGVVEDYTGKKLTDDEIAALVNPSWEHTLGGTQTSEYGILILDTDFNFGGNTMFVTGRWENAIYKQTTGPGYKVDIIFDSLSAAGREDFYQFRAGGDVEATDADATVDIFGAVLLATPSRESLKLTWGAPEGARRDTRTYVGGNSPSLNELKGHLITLTYDNPESKKLEEHISNNYGYTFEKLADVFKGGVGMAKSVLISKETGERGVVAYEGTQLVFKRSGDGYAGSVDIFNFKKAVPMAIYAANGVIYVEDGTGVRFQSSNMGATWASTGPKTPEAG